MKIVSGRTGAPHVTSQQFRQILEGTVGQGSYILKSGENLEPELVSSNLLKIRSGMMCHHGNVACVEIGTYDEVELSNGSQGMKRIDLVVNRYTRNEETGIESNEWIVIEGTPVSANPVVPSYTIGNLQDGDLVDDCPVIQITYDGLNVTEVKKLLSVVKNASEMEAELAELNSKIGALEHIGSFCATADASTGTLLYDINRYKRLVFIPYDADTNLCSQEIQVNTFVSKKNVCLLAYALKNYQATIIISHVSNTSIRFYTRELTGWSECWFRVYGVL